MPFDHAMPVWQRAIKPRRDTSRYPQLQDQARCSSGYTAAPGGRLRALPPVFAVHRPAPAAAEAEAPEPPARIKTADRPWTVADVLRAVQMRSCDLSDREIGAALGRHNACISQKIGWRKDDPARQAMTSVPDGDAAGLMVELVLTARRSARLPGWTELSRRLGWAMPRAHQAMTGLIEAGWVTVDGTVGQPERVCLLPTGRSLWG